MICRYLNPSTVVLAARSCDRRLLATKGNRPVADVKHHGICASCRIVLYFVLFTTTLLDYCSTPFAKILTKRAHLQAEGGRNARFETRRDVPKLGYIQAAFWRAHLRGVCPQTASATKMRVAGEQGVGGRGGARERGRWADGVNEIMLK